MEARHIRKPRLAEIMDNIVFDWVDEIPHPAKGRKGGNSGRWEALIDMLKSKPDHIIRLEKFFDVNMRYIATAFRKYVNKHYPDEAKKIEMASRKEGDDSNGEPIYVLYAAYFAEDPDGEESN